MDVGVWENKGARGVQLTGFYLSGETVEMCCELRNGRHPRASKDDLKLVFGVLRGDEMMLSGTGIPTCAAAPLVFPNEPRILATDPTAAFSIGKCPEGGGVRYAEKDSHNTREAVASIVPHATLQGLTAAFSSGSGVLKNLAGHSDIADRS
jgi:hypothetical protein